MCGSEIWGMMHMLSYVYALVVHINEHLNASEGAYI